jgi:lipopolysaccharide transport system permease protein
MARGLRRVLARHAAEIRSDEMSADALPPARATLHSAAPPPLWANVLRAFFVSPWKHRALIWQLVRREVVGRYRGSVGGLLWSFLNPLLLLAVYTFVFSTVFRSRWSPDGDESRVDFALILFVGMIVHGIFAECVNRAPRLILENVNFVKRVVFPLEVLPWVAMGATLFHAAISLLVWAAAFLIFRGYLPWTTLWLPLVLLPLVVLTVGVAWFLAATGVYLRDVAQTTGIFTAVLLFVSPVFFPITAIPEAWRPLITASPLTFPIEQARAVLVWGRMPDFGGLALYALAALAVAFAGLAWFQKTRRGFADVI